MTDAFFLRAIQADPDDDTLRLAYADWLEEQGDARGDFLRAEVALRAGSLTPDEHQRMSQAAEAAEPRWLRLVSRDEVKGEAGVDVDDPRSVTFRFLARLCERCDEHRDGWLSAWGVGHSLQLSWGETKDVIERLSSRRMIEWRSGSRRRRTTHDMSSVVISSRGRAHVKAILAGRT